MLYYIKAGGPILYVLLILSVVSLGVILERSLCFIKNKTSVDSMFKKEIKELLIDGKYSDRRKIKEKEIQYYEQ